MSTNTNTFANLPKFSIITVCFNSGTLIERTLQSVVGQYYPNIEYIIIDGGSTDETLSIINKFQSKISRIISEKDNGIYDAMNKGLAKSTGEFVYFLNSGDYLSHDGVISEIILKIKQYPDFEIYTGDIEYYDKKNKSERISGYRKKPVDIIARVINHQSIIARKDIFDRCGGFDTKYTIYADYDWLLRTSVKYGARIKYTGILFAYYLKEGKSDLLWRRYLHERLAIVKVNSTTSQLLQLSLFYPSDAIRYLINRIRGLFILVS